jgi:predicted Zn-dependent protease
LPAVFAVAGALALAGCVTEGTGLGLDIVPDSQVEQMGLDSWKEIKAQTPVSRNVAHQREAQEVASRVLRASGKNPNEWEVVVFASDEPNAFALPGKKIGVYDGMFSVADTPDKLAAVIGHEIGHVDAAHSAQRVNTEAGTQLGVQLISNVLGSSTSVSPETLQALLGAGAQYGVILPYSRNQELEADGIGLRYMAQAGYDPYAVLDLWRGMSQLGPNQPTWLSTHPAPEERIAALERMIPQVTGARPR